LCDRATRRPEESLEDLLIKSRDQAEAWHFHRDGLFPYLFKRMAGQYFARYDQEIPRTSKNITVKVGQKGVKATLWICWRRWTMPPVETLMRRERRPPTPNTVFDTILYLLY